MCKSPCALAIHGVRATAGAAGLLGPGEGASAAGGLPVLGAEKILGDQNKSQLRFGKPKGRHKPSWV